MTEPQRFIIAMRMGGLALQPPSFLRGHKYRLAFKVISDGAIGGVQFVVAQHDPQPYDAGTVCYRGIVWALHPPTKYVLGWLACGCFIEAIPNEPLPPEPGPWVDPPDLQIPQRTRP